MADIELVIKIPKEEYSNILKSDNSAFAGCVSKECMMYAIKNGTPLPKGHGDLIDRSNLVVCPIDITDLPIDKCLMVYYAEDIDNAPTIIEADTESEEVNDNHR